MIVPHRPQEQPNSCLAACVRMILAYYGLEKSESELRRILRTRGMGTSPARVMIELPRLGFLAMVLDGSFDLLAEYLRSDCPCIIHLWTEPLTAWADRDPVIHAVVVTSFSGDSVTVNDPGSFDPGQMIPVQEFFDAWRGADFMMLVIQPLDMDMTLHLTQA